MFCATAPMWTLLENILGYGIEFLNPDRSGTIGRYSQEYSHLIQEVDRLQVKLLLVLLYCDHSSVQ